MKGKLAGILALIISLSVAAIITSSIPQYVPNEYDLPADAAGLAETAAATAQLVGVEAATSIRAGRKGQEKTLTTNEVFVVVRIKLTAHRRTFIPRVGLVTADGYSYTSLDEYGFPGERSVYIGESDTTSYSFELPREKLEGSVITVKPRPVLGVQPIRPVIMFKLPPLSVTAGPIMIPATEKAVVR